jgi:hypothetical protein
MASREVSRACSADARIAHWPRRFLIRARLVHDVLRVVLARVGLRAAPREQGRKPETKEGLPQRCEGPPSAPAEVKWWWHGCRGASSTQMGSDAAALSICTLISFLSVRVFAARKPKIGQWAHRDLSLRLPKSGADWGGSDLTKASLKLLAPIACNNN